MYKIDIKKAIKIHIVVKLLYVYKHVIYLDNYIFIFLSLWR